MLEKEAGDECDVNLLGPPPGGDDSDIEDGDEDVTVQNFPKEVSSEVEISSRHETTEEAHREPLRKQRQTDLQWKKKDISTEEKANSVQAFEDVCAQFLAENEDLFEKSPEDIYLNAFMPLLEHLLNETCQYAHCHQNMVDTRDFNIFLTFRILHFFLHKYVLIHIYFF